MLEHKVNFHSWRSLYTIFHSDCTSTFPPTIHRVLFSPHPYQHFCSLLIGNRWYLTVIFIYISLILSIFSYTCWQLVCLPLEKIYAGLLPIFNWMVIMIIAIELYQCYTLCILTYSDTWFAHYFDLFYRLPFYFVDYFFCCMKLLSLMNLACWFCFY